MDLSTSGSLSDSNIKGPFSTQNGLLRRRITWTSPQLQTISSLSPLHMNWLCLAASPGHSAVEELEDQEELSSRLLWTCHDDNDNLIDVIE